MSFYDYTQDDIWDAGADAGRREMLWLMALGAACASALYYRRASEIACVHGPDGFRVRDLNLLTDMRHVDRDVALQALADLGDEQAREEAWALNSVEQDAKLLGCRPDQVRYWGDE